MAKEKPAQNVQYAGNTVEEQIQNAQISTVGRGILQRFGQQMTEDERNFIFLCLGFFIREIPGEMGAEPQYQPQQPPQQPGMQGAPQVPPPPRRNPTTPK